MRKIKTILRKEWAEVFKNRMVIFTVAFLPLLLIAIPLGVIYSSRGAVAAGGLNSAMTPQLSAACPKGLAGGQCFQVLLISEFMLLFMLVPVAIPVTIAAYSIVGEKTTHSLEPLLATPISTLELLAGKALAAILPAILATFAAFGIFVLGTGIMVTDRLVLSALLDPRWLIAIFIVGPLLAILAVTFALMISSRVNDPRVAEQLSMVVIVPVLAGFFGQVFGLFFLDRRIISITAAVMFVVDVGLIYWSTRIFQRETILTRWK